jgi:hypothetical protein
MILSTCDIHSESRGVRSGDPSIFKLEHLAPGRPDTKPYFSGSIELLGTQSRTGPHCGAEPMELACYSSGAMCPDGRGYESCQRHPTQIRHRRTNVENSLRKQPMPVPLGLLPGELQACCFPNSGFNILTLVSTTMYPLLRYPRTYPALRNGVAVCFVESHHILSVIRTRCFNASTGANSNRETPFAM